MGNYYCQFISVCKHEGLRDGRDITTRANGSSDVHKACTVEPPFVHFLRAPLAFADICAKSNYGDGAQPQRPGVYWRQGPPYNLLPQGVHRALPYDTGIYRHL